MGTHYKNYGKRLTKRPKIYFTDTGLVCSLLGIGSADEIDFHYLKGPLFETMAFTEILKANLNLGDPFSLYYWRDNRRKEIDMVIDAGSRHCAVEMKSGVTVQPRHLEGLRYWCTLTESPPGDAFLVYGGSESLQRSGFNLVGWKQIYSGVIQRALRCG